MSFRVDLDNPLFHQAADLGTRLIMGAISHEDAAREGLEIVRRAGMNPSDLMYTFKVAMNHMKLVCDAMERQLARDMTTAKGGDA